LKPIQPKTFTLSYENIENGWLIEDAQLQLESGSFDCGGRRINKDFEELVKSNKFPVIQIEVYEIMPKRANFQAKIVMTIAGVKNHFLYLYHYKKARKSTIMLL
jgi:hypothetical protein